MNLADWFERISTLRCKPEGNYEKPQKPLLLLAILELIDRGLVSQNAFRFPPGLEAAFGAYFAIVRREGDEPLLHNPIYHLQKGDKLWTVTVEGSPITSPKHPSTLRNQRGQARFPDELWHILASELHREQIRETILRRYFPDHYDALRVMIRERLKRGVEASDAAEPSPEFGRHRSLVFGKVVLQAYQFTCAACGIDMAIAPEDLSVVSAARLVPTDVKRNDHPSNGIALCKNHQWAFGQRLIAPDPSLIWHTSSRIDSRRSKGEADLASLHGRTLVPPKDRAFRPAEASLDWRFRTFQAAFG